MAKLTTQTRLRKALKKAVAPQSGWMDLFDCITGRVDGTVLTEIPGLVYVRDVLNGQVLAVYNGVVSNRANVLVEVGRRVDQPGLWRIKGEKQVFSSPSTGSEIGVHATQHQFPEGSDIGWWDRKQVLAFSVLVSDPSNFIVRVYGGVFHSANGVVQVDHQDLNLSSYVVTAGARFISIEADDDGVLSVHEGAMFGAPAIATVDDIPIPGVGKYLIAFALLYEGQTELLNDDIRVVMPIGMVAKNVGLQINEASADTPADGDKFGFWDLVDEALKSITWSNIKAVLKTYFDTLYSVLSHSHDVSLNDLTDVNTAGVADTNALVYDEASETWIPGEAVGGGGGTTHYEPVTVTVEREFGLWHVDGALATGTSVAHAILVTRPIKIASVYIYCTSNGTASSTICDVNLNGITIFTTQANRPTLGNAAAYAVSGVPDVIDLVIGDVLTLDIDQVATGAADLAIHLMETTNSLIYDDEDNLVVVEVPN